MHIIFCADPLAPRAVDDAYTGEAQAAMGCGLEYHLISYEQLVHEQDAAAAVRRVPLAAAPELAIYRGWMVRPSDYQALYEALFARGLQLINTPDAYRTCHYLPESYPLIRDETPATVWLPLDACGDLDTILALLAPFGDQPVIVKDYVKSRKHEWFEACYIPSAADRQAVTRVVTRFLELQGDDICEGLVFRAYVTFQPIGAHPQSGMPLTREHSLFFLDRALLASAAVGHCNIPVLSQVFDDSFFEQVGLPGRFYRAQEVATVFERALAELPWQPELICIFSGYDGHHDDCGRRITEWTEQDFAHMTRLVLNRTALAHCPVLSVHGGGYKLPVTIASAMRHIEVLATYWPGKG